MAGQIILTLLILAAELFVAAFAVSLFLPDNNHPQGNKSGIAIRFELAALAMVIAIFGACAHVYHLGLVVTFLYQKIQKQHLYLGWSERGGWSYVIAYFLVWVAAYRLALWIES